MPLSSLHRRSDRGSARPPSPPDEQIPQTGTHSRTPLSRASLPQALGGQARTEGMLIGRRVMPDPQPAGADSTRRNKLLRIGKITVGALDEWSLQPGTVTSWHPTIDAREKAQGAPVSAVPI